MYTVTGITNDTLQQQTITIPDGTGDSFTITLYFVPLQQAWFMKSLVSGIFILNGYRVTNSPNMLNQYRNQIPFGLACFSKGSREPSLQDDFSSNYSTLLVLTAAECQQYAAFLSGEKL